jgi:hypothetical protein
VSTITSLTCIVSVVSTLLFLLLSFLAVRAGQRLSTLHKRHPEWWKLWAYGWPEWTRPWKWRFSAGDTDWLQESRERQPLLQTRTLRLVSDLQGTEPIGTNPDGSGPASSDSEGSDFEDDD